jgi:hypothetical protein
VTPAAAPERVEAAAAAVEGAVTPAAAPERAEAAAAVVRLGAAPRREAAPEQAVAVEVRLGATPQREPVAAVEGVAAPGRAAAEEEEERPQAFPQREQAAASHSALGFRARPVPAKALQGRCPSASVRPPARQTMAAPGRTGVRQGDPGRFPARPKTAPGRPAGSTGQNSFRSQGRRPPTRSGQAGGRPARARLAPRRTLQTPRRGRRWMTALIRLPAPRTPLRRAKCVRRSRALDPIGLRDQPVRHRPTGYWGTPSRRDRAPAPSGARRRDGPRASFRFRSWKRRSRRSPIQAPQGRLDVFIIG